MRSLEGRGQPYLFRQWMTKRVKQLTAKLAAQSGWKDAGLGWQASSANLQLQGWTRKRHIVVLRRPLARNAAPAPKTGRDDGQRDLAFVEVLPSNQNIREYSVLVASLDCEERTVAQLHRDRADAENAFDELQNHWGWGGFVTRDL